LPNNKEDATALEIQLGVPDIRDLNDRLGLDLSWVIFQALSGFSSIRMMQA